MITPRTNVLPSSKTFSIVCEPPTNVCFHRFGSYPVAVAASVTSPAGALATSYVPSGRLVATEQFDDAWYPGEALDTTVFAEDGAITRITITVLYQSREARDTARRSGMEHGMAAGYNRLEEVLSSLEG